MKEMVLGAQKQYKDQNRGYVSNGLMFILKYYDDPDMLFNAYLSKIKGEEKRKQIRGSANSQTKMIMPPEPGSDGAINQSSKSLKTLKTKMSPTGK
jgi:hypothetical protein